MAVIRLCLVFLLVLSVDRIAGKVAQLIHIDTSRKRPQDAGCIAPLNGNTETLCQIFTSSWVTRRFDQTIMIMIKMMPFFGSLMCDWFCDDDDDVSTTTSSSEDDYDWWGCNCRPRTRTTPSSILLPAIPGMGYNITRTRNGWIFAPRPDSAASANSPVAQTTTVTRVSSVATTVPAGATTPAAGATTAAAGATTAAAGATTAAATTAAATTAATTAAPAA